MLYCERSPAEKIPVEIATLILQHLSTSDRKNAALVNSKWYQANLEIIFQKRQKFVINGLTNTNHLKVILSIIENIDYQHYRLQFLQENFHLNLKEIMAFIKNNSLRIYSLSFLNCSFPFILIEEIMINCVNLEALLFKKCSCTGFEEAVLIPNLQEKLTRRNLKSLEVKMCDWLTEYVFEMFVDVYPSIKRLRVTKYSVKFTVNFLNSLENSKPLFLNRSIRECFHDKFFEELLSSPWIRMEELLIPDPYNFYDIPDRTDFRKFLQTQKGLKIIDTRHCLNFDTDSFELLCDQCPDLDGLSHSLFYTRGESSVKRVLEVIAKSKLKCLTLECFEFFREDTTFAKFRRNDNIKFLDIHYRWSGKSATMGSTFLTTILKTFCNLVYLDLSKTTIQGPKAELVKIIFQNQIQLKFLKLNNCDWISDRAFRKSYLTKLEHLELTNSRLTQAAFKNFDFPKLMFIRLQGCWAIADESFSLLPQRLPLLTYLDVSDTRISEKTILNVCKGLKFLHCINIVKRKNPPMIDIETISHHCPSLRFIRMGRWFRKDYKGKGYLYAYSYLEKTWIKYEDTLYKCSRCQPSKRRLKSFKLNC